MRSDLIGQKLTPNPPPPEPHLANDAAIDAHASAAVTLAVSNLAFFAAAIVEHSFSPTQPSPPAASLVAD